LIKLDKIGIGAVMKNIKQIVIAGCVVTGIGVIGLPIAVLFRIGLLGFFAVVFILTGIIVFGIAAAEMKKIKNISGDEEKMKMSLANYAFDNLLKRGRDYTVMAEAAGAILVKKEIKWATFFCRNGKVINAVFIIITDKNTFAFQAKEGKIFLIPADLVLTLYDFK
jgi:hypothetical protein